MNPDNLVQAAIDNCDAGFPGAYYGPASGLSLGAGLFYDEIPIPRYDEASKQFVILDSTVLVLTHECDVANEREFNDHVLVCPVISVAEYARIMVAANRYDMALNLLKEIAANTVYRVFYLPPPSSLVGSADAMAKGGMIYLNHITSTPVAFFKDAGRGALFSLSSYAQMRLDQKIQNHLFRPKSELQPIVM